MGVTAKISWPAFGPVALRSGKTLDRQALPLLPPMADATTATTSRPRRNLRCAAAVGVPCERPRPARPFDPCDSTCMHLSSVYACRPRIHLLASLCSHACDSSRAQCSCCMLALAVSFYKRSDPLRYSDHSIPNSSLHSHVPKPAFNLHASMPVESKPTAVYCIGS